MDIYKLRLVRDPCHVCRPITDSPLRPYPCWPYPGHIPAASLETSRLAPVLLSACTNPRNSCRTCTFLLSSRVCTKRTQIEISSRYLRNNTLYLVLLLTDQLKQERIS